MTSLGEFAYAKLLECDLLKANQIEGNINLTDISTNTLSFNDKWKFSLDTSNNLLLTNVMHDIVSLSGNSETGYISFLGEGGGGGGVTDLSDLNDVTPPNPSDLTTNGSIMYYDQPTNRYSFTNEFAYALSTWNVKLPFSFTDIDLQILQGANDLSKNIYIGGAKRTTPPTEGRSIGIGEESGQTSQKNNCIAIGYKAGKNNQGLGIVSSGDSIAIGNNAAENGQEDSAISIGNSSGQTSQKASSIAIGNNAGNLNQNVNSLAIGYNAGKTNQGVNSIAIGFNTGLSDCAGYSTFIGTSCGNTGSDSYAVGIGYLTNSVDAALNSIAIGREALYSGGGQNSIAIGKFAGRSNFPNNSIAIGSEAGQNSGGQNCIYLGEGAANNGNNHNNVIVLNASSSVNNPAGSDRCYIKPLRNDAGSSFVKYDVSSGEVTYNTDIFQEQLEQPQVNAPAGTGNLTLINGAISGTLNRLNYTPPLIPALPPSRYASSIVNQNVTSGTFQLLFTNAFTPVGITSTASTPFTIQQTGIYQLTFNINATGSTTWNWHYLNIYKNNVVVQRSQFYSPSSLSQHTCHGGGFILSLTANDFFEFEVYSNGSTTLQGYASINQIA
jgi:hypothetical protein